MQNKILGVAAAIGLAAASSAAVAATKTTTFTVQANVANNCFINSAANINFGTYTPGAGAVTQSGSIVVRCSNGTTYGIGLSAGGAASFAPRKMANGGNNLEYNLYTDVGLTTVWINPATAGAAAGNQGGTGTGLGNTFTHTVFGQVPDNTNNQAATAGLVYTDTITVTINF